MLYNVYTLYPAIVRYKDLEPVSKQITIVIGLTVVGFMAFGLMLSFYRNILFEQKLEEIAAQNNSLQKSIDESHRDLEYYHSTQYKDKYAKQSLGRLNADEKLLIILDEPRKPDLATIEGLTPTETQQAAYEEYLRQIPAILHWQLYLFQKDRLEELKRGLL